MRPRIDSPETILFGTLLLSPLPFLAVQLFPGHLHHVLQPASLLAFRDLAGIFCVVVSLSIFSVAWYTFHQSGDRHALFLGCAFLLIGILDLLHTLSYAGMPALVTENSANKAAQFWLAARAAAACAFLASGFILPETDRAWVSKPFLLCGALLLGAALFIGIVIFPGSLPDVSADGRGLTPFALGAEVAIIVLLMASAAVYWGRFKLSGDRLLLYFLVTLVLLIASEGILVVSRGVSDTYNGLAHFYKIAAFFLICRAVFAASVIRPYARLAAVVEQLRNDIERRRQIEEALRAGNERFRLIAENVTDVIWTLDLSTRKFSYVSPSVQQLRGFTPEEAMAQSLDQILTPPSLAFVTGRLDELIHEISAGRAMTGWGTAEVEQPCKDGSTVWTEVTTSLVRDGRGTPASVIGISRNITERKRAEKALIESEQRYRRLVQTVTDYIYAVQVGNGRIAETEHSPGCLAVTGYRPEEFCADPLLWQRMVHEEDRAAVSARMSALFERLPGGSFEHRIVHPDGSLRWVKHTIVPRYGEQDGLAGWDGLVLDITERKKLEEQLRQAQKMEAVGQLAGGIAHDFNNILSAIVGYGTLLQMKTENDDPLRANIDPILDAADRASNLTHSLLAFSRKQVLKQEPVDLNAIVRRMEKLLRRIMGEDIEIKTRFWRDRVVVNADRGQLEQVLMNLAANARDAMPQGGRFVIETNSVELGGNEQLFQARVQHPGAYAALSVSDTGTGMDEATRKKVFEPFFTTKDPGKGTGLGLSMVYGIVEQHQGGVALESEPGAGATFRIYLPLLDPSVVTADGVRAPAQAAPLPTGTETILVAEDDDALRELSGTVLRESGYTVIAARDGQEAVELFRLHAATVKMVLLDMIMPRMNGREAYQEIRRQKDDVKALFVSGYTADKVPENDELIRQATLMNKPVLPGELLKKVREVLDA